MEITKFYGGSHPSEIPFYTQREVALICGVAPSTLRSWMAGTKVGNWQDTLIHGPEGASGRLSFENLVEAYVLRLMQERGGVSTRRLRNLVLSERKQDVHRPFLNPERYLVGSGVYLEHGEDLLDASEWHQYTLKSVVSIYLSRVRLMDGRPVELFPSYPGESLRAVKIDPRIRFGKPIVANTGIRTYTIYGRVRSGEEIPDIAAGYDINVDLVSEAYKYEVSRRAE